jgi:16S rRNA (guanine966-N2)-methyltransferase
MKEKRVRRPGEVRIIGGAWRGRRVAVPDLPGLRPTGDRIRETLFNWLAPGLPGARCLDLFAGTGVLGLEALSRGAASAWFVEQQPAAARALEESLRRFRGEGAQVVVADARRFLAGTPQAFDVVFLDPPFGEFDLGELCTLLAGGWLAPGGHVYLEMPADGALPALPPRWTVAKEKTAGQVRFGLARGS